MMRKYIKLLCRHGREHLFTWFSTAPRQLPWTMNQYAVEIFLILHQSYMWELFFTYICHHWIFLPSWEVKNSTALLSLVPGRVEWFSYVTSHLWVFFYRDIIPEMREWLKEKILSVNVKWKNNMIISLEENIQ